MVREIEEIMHMKNITCYGLIETSRTLSGTKTTDPVELKGNSVGEIMPGVQIKFIDPDTLEDVGPEGPGEICVKATAL